MCRQFITAGKLSNLRKLIEKTYNEDIKIKLLGEIEKEEENLEEEIEKELEETKKQKKDYDAVLTHNIPVISYSNGEKFLTKMKWGIRFDPEKKSPLIFNSRDDTVQTKPFWKKTFDKNRILIPMLGFYEWQDKGRKKKVKTKITLPGRNLFMVPGLFWKSKQDVNEFTLITTSPSSFMKKIHNRMPVILDDENVFDYFTDSFEENAAKLKPAEVKVKTEEEDQEGS
ncbi:MAG: SOS response-associated peptidase family protein [Bacteroidetes bacterium]|nr:SOS response-associated peptidase family protein [Bacteroidota bacterium]